MLAGAGNESCATESAIGAVVSNVDSVVLTGYRNTASDRYAFVGDGQYNVSSGFGSFVGSGILNSAAANGSFIGGEDTAYSYGLGATAAPGNAIAQAATDSFIGAGDQNSTSVDDYIASRPAAQRQILERVRVAIRKALPRAEECISYKMPAYAIDGTVVVYFAGWKLHYSPRTRAVYRR